MRCCVIGCKSDSGRKTPGLSFHSFPEHEDLRRDWTVATGRPEWTPKQSLKICSLHFENTMLIKKKKLTLLLPNAVPILEIKSCIPSSSSISIQGERDIEMEDNLNIHIDPAVELLPSTSCQNSVGIEIFPTSEQPSMSNVPEYTPRTLRNKWNHSEKVSSECLKKLKSLREKSRRLTKKVAYLPIKICYKNIFSRLSNNARMYLCWIILKVNLLLVTIKFYLLRPLPCTILNCVYITQQKDLNPS